jgi:hypothetical protein
MGQLVTRFGNHKMDVGLLEKDARDRLVELRLDDLDELWSLRLSAQERVWGVITLNVFSLLWWDPEHTVYEVKKKHT